MGARLSYLLWLHDRGGGLEELVEQELKLYLQFLRSKQSNGSGPADPIMPNPITAMVRLRPGEDPLLRLETEAIKQLDPGRPATFNSTRPAVAVCLEFLGAGRDLPPLGLIPVARAGDFFVGWINLDNVPAFTMHKAVVRMDVLSSWTPTGPTRTNQEESSAGALPTSKTVTGRGVHLAVIDRGFDFLHPSFVRKVNGKDRARTLWLHDMELPPPPSASAGTLGQRLTGEEIQAALDWHLSPEGTPPGPIAVETHLKRLATSSGDAHDTNIMQEHGTAVTGIAAGSECEDHTNGVTMPVCGIASEADLLLIAIGGHDETRFANTTEVIAAFQAAFEDGSAPCVTLMANSDNLGPHDGSLIGERFLDELLLLPGRAIVLSAGNLNHVSVTDPKRFPYHAVSMAAPGNDRPPPLVLRFDSGALSPDSAEVWFQPPAGVPATATLSIKVRENPIEPAIIIRDDALWAEVLSPRQNPRDETTVLAQLQYDDAADAYCLRLVFHPAPFREIVKSEWTIDVRAVGSVHGWLDRNNDGIRRWVGAPAETGANKTTLGSPASATRPLTVGSIANAGGVPSTFSGRGPLRMPREDARKPDLVAIGEKVRAPLGNPSARRRHQTPAPDELFATFESGTSFAAPQVAGACALLFERFGPAATWADIRQAILQATKRPGDMPAPDTTGWDNACGYGLLNLDALLTPPTPEVDLWLPKTPTDDGTEPFVAWTFWNSPALVLEDAAGTALDIAKVATGKAAPTQLRVRVANRGKRSANDVVLTVWWAPLGATYPLPHSENGNGAWKADGLAGGEVANNRKRLAPIAPGGFVEERFDWAPPHDEEGRIVPHLLLATVDTADDPYVHTDTACAQNNVAMLSIAAVPPEKAAEFQVLGTADTDGLIFWCTPPEAISPADTLPVRVEALPLAALPWRDAAMIGDMFDNFNRTSRPLHGSPDTHEDTAARFSRNLNSPVDIAEITDVLNAETLEIQNGTVTITSQARLILPRLRIVPGAPMMIKATAPEAPAGAIHMLHLSGGRRVGGGTVQIVRQ